MSLPNWFYPIVMLWLVAIPGIDRQPQNHSSKRSVWLMLVDTLFLLPWILNLFLDEPMAAWIGLEILSLVLLFDLLWRRPSESLREAWVKVSISWFLSWLMIGTAVALAGVHPIVENLLYPLPDVDAERVRPVLSGFLFAIGLGLKLGLPPLQQGVIDLMDVVDAESHRRWSLQMRWAIAFGAWQLMPAIFGGLSGANQQVFAGILLVGCLGGWLVSGVQAGVQRTLGYMGSILVLPPLLSFLFMDTQLGMNSMHTLLIWLVTMIGFLSLGWVYHAWPQSGLRESDQLLWTDAASPCVLPDWFLRFRVWMVWSVLSSLGLAALVFQKHQWILGFLLLLLALACTAACLRQLGIQTWKEQKGK